MAKSSLLQKLYRNPIMYFLGILLVFGNGSWLQLNYNSQFKIILLSVLIIYLFVNGAKAQFTKIPPISIGIPLFLIFSTLLNFSFKSNFNTLVSTFSIVFILSLFNRKSILSILNIYFEIILFLIYVTFIVSFLKIFLPGLPYLFPDVSFGSFHHFKNLFLFIENTQNSLSPFRVQSIFWEPGAWAINQTLAFYWYIFYQGNYKKYLTFFLSAVITASTTGLLSMLLISIYIYFTNLDHELNKKIKKIFIILNMILITLFTYSSSKYFSLMSTDQSDSVRLFDVATRTLLYQTIEKFKPGGISFGSNQSRFDTYKESFELSKNKPLLGVGMLKFQYRPFVTSTFGEIFYQSGYIFLFFWLVLFYQFFKKTNLLLSFPLIFLLLNGEAYAYGTLFILLAIYGSKELLVKNSISFHN